MRFDREQVKRLESERPGLPHDGAAKSGCDTLAAVLRPDKHAPEPRGEVPAPFQVVGPEGRGAQRLAALMGNPCDREDGRVQVLPKPFDALLDRLIRQDAAPMGRDSRRQGRDEFRMVREAGDLHRFHCTPRARAWQ